MIMLRQLSRAKPTIRHQICDIEKVLAGQLAAISGMVTLNFHRASSSRQVFSLVNTGNADAGQSPLARDFASMGRSKVKVDNPIVSTMQA